MMTVKASQKLFTYPEVARLTGICVEHLRNAENRFRFGFIARAYEAAAPCGEQWLFMPWELNVLTTLLPHSTH